MTTFFRPSAHSDGGYGVPLIPLAVGTYLGGRYVIGAAAEKYAEHLNEKYDFTSVKPDEALEQIGLAENQAWLNAIIGFMGPAANRVQKAPTDMAQAYVKSAYLMALAARYLKNPGLASAAKATLGRVDSLKINSKDIGAIVSIMGQGWAAVQAVSGPQIVSDPQLRALSVYFGERPKGGTGLPQMVADQQKYKLDPSAEEAATKDALTPGASEEEKKKKRKNQRVKARRARARKQRLMVYGGVGTVAVLGLVLLAFKGV